MGRNSFKTRQREIHPDTGEEVDLLEVHEVCKLYKITPIISVAPSQLKYDL